MGLKSQFVQPCRRNASASAQKNINEKSLHAPGCRAYVVHVHIDTHVMEWYAVSLPVARGPCRFFGEVVCVYSAKMGCSVHCTLYFARLNCYDTH